MNSPEYQFGEYFKRLFHNSEGVEQKHFDIQFNSFRVGDLPSFFYPELTFGAIHVQRFQRFKDLCVMDRALNLMQVGLKTLQNASPIVK